MITIAKARKIIGQDANKLSDKELAYGIEVASLLKELFFKSYTTSINSTKIVSSTYDKESGNLSSRI